MSKTIFICVGGGHSIPERLLCETGLSKWLDSFLILYSYESIEEFLNKHGMVSYSKWCSQEQTGLLLRAGLCELQERYKNIEEELQVVVVNASLSTDRVKKGSNRAFVQYLKVQNDRIKAFHHNEIEFNYSLPERVRETIGVDFIRGQNTLRRIEEEDIASYVFDMLSDTEKYRKNCYQMNFEECLENVKQGNLGCDYYGDAEPGINPEYVKYIVYTGTFNTPTEDHFSILKNLSDVERQDNVRILIERPAVSFGKEGSSDNVSHTVAITPFLSFIEGSLSLSTLIIDKERHLQNIYAHALLDGKCFETTLAYGFDTYKRISEEDLANLRLRGSLILLPNDVEETSISLELKAKGFPFVFFKSNGIHGSDVRKSLKKKCKGSGCSQCSCGRAG